MHHIHYYLVQFHIVLGALALVMFWIPIATRKGSKNHRFYGNIYVWLMYGVSVSGLITSTMVLIDPIGIRHPGEFFSATTAYSIAESQRTSSLFLWMLSLLVFMNIRQSTLVLAAKANRSILKTWHNLGTTLCLGIIGIFVGILGWSKGQFLLTIFGVISLISSVSFYQYVYKPTLQQREWIIAHLGAVIGSGIGAYTAFFAFGGRYFFAEILPGQWQIIPWILPAVIGTFATIYSNKKYRNQFKVS